GRMAVRSALLCLWMGARRYIATLPLQPRVCPSGPYTVETSCHLCRIPAINPAVRNRGTGSRSVMKTTLTIVGLSLAASLVAQEWPHTPAFRAYADTVLVPVTVTNHRGETLNGLRQGSFSLLEDGVPQDIVSFTGEDTPFSVGVILDMSGSMKATLGAAKEAVHVFLATTNPDDEFFLLTV